MYTISEKVIKFFTKAMKVELTAAGSKIFSEIKIPRGIFTGDVLLPLLLVTAMMQLNHILRIFIGGL